MLAQGKELFHKHMEMDVEKAYAYATAYMAGAIKDFLDRTFYPVAGRTEGLPYALVVSAGIAAWGRWWAPVLSEWPWLLQAANTLVGLALTVAMFALLYKLIPSVPVAWGDVWHGALVTAILFTLGKTLIALYIGRSAVASGFGAAGSLVALLVWVYWSAQVFFVGAEFTRLMSEHRRGEERVAAPAIVSAPDAQRSPAATPPGPVIH